MTSRDMFKRKGWCILTNTYCGSKWNNSTWNNTDCKSCTVPLLYREKIISGNFDEHIDNITDEDYTELYSWIVVAITVVSVWVAVFIITL